jgi:hypothetical protein
MIATNSDYQRDLPSDLGTKRATCGEEMAA